MSGKEKGGLKQQRDKVKENVTLLLQENKGMFGTGELWQAYNSKFKTPVTKKNLGFNRMNELFEVYKTDFEVRDDHVFLKNFKKTDKYGMPLPAPIKPLWGAAAKNSPAVPTQRAGGGSTASGGSAPQTPQRGKGKVPPHPSRGGASQTLSASQTSINISSTESDSDSDSDVRITGQEPPGPGSGRGGPGGANGGSSGFLSFDVPPSERQQQQQQILQPPQQVQQMVFNNPAQQHHHLLQQQQVYMQQAAGRGGGGGGGGRGGGGGGPPQSLADLTGGRGRMLDNMIMQPGQVWAQPVLMRFPVPQHAVGRVGHPGVMAGQ